MRAKVTSLDVPGLGTQYKTAPAMPSDAPQGGQPAAHLPDSAIAPPATPALPLWQPAAAVAAFLIYEVVLHHIAAMPQAQLAGLMLGGAPFALMAFAFCLGRLRGPSAQP